MFGRNYQVFNIHLYNDVSTFLALKMDEDSSHGVRVEFTHAQTRMFEIATKKNTELFDQLAQIRGIPLSPSANLLESFLYDVMIVDMQLPRDAGEGTVLCYPAVGGGVGMVEPQALAQIVYEDGFVIAGVPVGGERVDLRYKPFIASASMARKNQYLFVNSQVYPDLMSRVSLDILRCDAEGFLSMPGLADDSEVSIAKLSAYIGLALSDGASVAEMREAYAARFPQDTNPADTLKLDERSACVFKDINIQIAFEKMGPYVWKSRQILPRMHRPKEVRTRAAADEDMLLLCGFFRTFIPDDRAGYDGYWAQHGPQVVEAWKKAIRALLGASALPEYPQAPLPIPEPRRECDKKDALTSCIAEYAWYWALALAYQRFDHLSIPKDEPDQGGLISKTRPDAADPDETCAYLTVCAPDAKEIRCALDLALHELKGEGVQARNTLWNIVKQAKNEENPELFECRKAGSDEYAGISGQMTIKGDTSAIGTNARFVQFRLGRARSYAYGACLERPSSEDSRANYSDGVGFCDDAYFDALEKLMLLKSDLSTPRRFDALIIRLPWIKGLICRMDFLKYFKDHAPDGEMTHITDVFGKPRSLYDQDENPQMHMLLSESMFKGAKYFKKLKSKPDDPWKEYWDRVRKTNATLLVAGRNSEPDTHSRLNYQYLCTNGMTTPEMLDLAEEAAKRANALLLDREAQIRYFTQPKQEDTESGDDKPDPENECKEADLSLAAAAAEAPAESGAEEEPEAPAEDGQEEAAPEAPETVEASTQEAASEASDALASADARTVFGEALKRNEELLATRYAKNALLAKARNIVLDAMFGRLRVAGDIRLLTPDLGKLLDEIIRANAPEGGKHAFSPINGFGLGHGCYYAAGEAAPWNRAKDGEIKNKDIVILRNPHYSVGEDAILTPLPEWHRARYDRYFGHLTGIVMLPASAFLTINGADADGDRGNVCCDERVLKAVKRTTADNCAWINEVVANKKPLLDAIDQKRDQADLTMQQRQFWNDIRDWFAKAVPDDVAGDAGRRWRKLYCPALVFSGSGTTKTYAAGRLRGGGLEERLWQSFLSSTQQRIGLMWIQALELATAAYAEEATEDVRKRREGIIDGCREYGLSLQAAPGDGPGALADRFFSEEQAELLRRFLAHWRVVTCSLNTANEIDSAKTGVRMTPHPLQSACELSRKCIPGGENPQWSALARFRQERNKQYARLRGETFDATIRSVLRKAGSIRVGGSDIPVNILPFRLYAAYGASRPTEENADAKTRPLHAFVEPPASLPKTPEDELLAGLKRLVNAFNARQSRRDNARDRRLELRKRFNIFMKCLLRRYSLGEALRIAQTLVGDGTFGGSFFGKFFDNPDAPTLELDTRLLYTLHEELAKNHVIAGFLWADQDGRKELLRKILGGIGLHPKETVKDEDLAGALVRFTDSEQGIYLLKALVRYLYETENMNVRDEDVANTPDELKNRMLEWIRAAQPDCDCAKTLLSACLEMSKSWAGLKEYMVLLLCGQTFVDHVKQGGKALAAGKTVPE